MRVLNWIMPGISVETLKLRERTREDRKKGSVRGEDGNQGAYLHFLWHIGGFFTTIACFGSIMWPLSIPVYQEQKKGALLMAAVIFERDSLGPLFDLANVVYPSILVTALVGNSVAFGSFSAAATLASRREYL
ncbi:bax inhibitor 1 [Quercus suber]|uniref:Bax inhibitor 1 n=1 Tax=Quercus suber TaxID=58331 RepID=A0AAW0IZ09_QUESU